MFGKKRIYLDWAAASPVSERARGVFNIAFDLFGNPGSPHDEGRKAKAILEDARTRIARLAQVKASDVIFTSGATEANNLAILGAVRAKGARGAHVLYQSSQHASVIKAVKELESEGAHAEPLVDIATQLRSETALVTMDAVNSETGEVFDTLAVRRALDAAKSGALLHVDAAQAPYALPFTLAHMGADMASLDAQKIGGVRGVGALLVRHHAKLTPLMHGGGQQGGRRPGTESPALATAFATALTGAHDGREKFALRASAMRASLLARMSGITGFEVNEGREQVPHILNISLTGRDTDYLVALLDTEGFAVSTKSACESDSDEGSRAVHAMTKDAERAKSTLRISWGPTTKPRDLERFADALLRTVRFLDENRL